MRGAATRSDEAVEVVDDGKRPDFVPSAPAAGEGTGTGKTVEQILAEDAEREAAIERLGMGADSQMGSPWAAGDALETLAQYPETRAHLADPGFLAMAAELSQHPERQRKYMRDPRMMQAIARLQGFSVAVSEEELREAERKGDIRQRRAPVQMEHLDHARGFETPDAAKAEGNARFKAKENSLALACYQWAKALLGRSAAAEAEGEARGAAALGGVAVGLSGDDGYPPTLAHARAMELTLELNSAAAYLALKLPEDAEAACSAVIEAAPNLPPGAPPFDTSKAFYRRCKARESRGMLKEAVADLKEALALAQKACDDAHADGGAANPRYKALRKEVARIAEEYKELQEREHSKWRAHQAATAQAKLDAECEAMRGKGIALDSVEVKDPEPKFSIMELESDSDDEPEASDTPANAYAPGVVQETDFSYWFKKELDKRLRKVRVARQPLACARARRVARVHVLTSERGALPPARGCRCATAFRAGL